MQSKATTMKTEQSRRSSSTNAGRRQLTVSRRANTYPYYRNKINSENSCYKCDNNEEYINVLNARIARIESLVENLSKTVKATTFTRKAISPTFGSVNLSKMSIDELLCFSSQLGIRLFGNLDKEKKNPSIKIEQEQNDNKENKILKNLEIGENSTFNDSQNINSPSPAHKG